MSAAKHWYNINSKETPEAEAQGKGKGGGRIIPQHVRRQLAMKSNAGGRGYCECCHETFSMDYMRYCRIGNFKTGLVCCDCRKERQLQTVR